VDFQYLQGPQSWNEHRPQPQLQAKKLLFGQAIFGRGQENEIRASTGQFPGRRQLGNNPPSRSSRNDIR
jgi:GH18 family chitinase